MKAQEKKEPEAFTDIRYTPGNDKSCNCDNCRAIRDKTVVLNLSGFKRKGKPQEQKAR